MESSGNSSRTLQMWAAEVSRTAEALRFESFDLQFRSVSLRERTASRRKLPLPTLQIPSSLNEFGGRGEMDTAQPTEEYALQRSIVAQLHDDVAQLLALCEMRLSEAQQDKNVEDARRYLNRSIAATRRIIQGADTARRSASSLIVMLQDIIEEMAGYRLRTSLAVTGAVPLLETEVVETLGRCVRELLFNVARHAGVLDAHINVSSTAREIVIRVADNGRGFSPGALESVKRRCFGLSSMRNSLADLGIVINIDSQPACGCTITIQAPV